MKTLILADIHRKNPFDLINKKIEEGIERIISIGDVDEPEILEELLTLNISKEILIGNHEYPFIHSFRNGILHRSIELFGWQDEDIKMKYKKWHESKILSDYAKKTLAGIRGNDWDYQFFEQLGDKKIAYIHGLFYSADLDLGLSSPLWGSLKNSQGRTNGDLLNHNLLFMQDQDYWVTFRGHDHKKDLQSIGINENPFMAGTWEHNISTEKKHKITLDLNRRYIATVGAFTWGDYAIFDSEKKTVDFERLD